jgi:hypothetical protein
MSGTIVDYEVSLATEAMQKAEDLLCAGRYREGRTEVGLAKYHLTKAERLSKEMNLDLSRDHRRRYTRLLLKLRVRDHILNMLGM